MLLKARPHRQLGSISTEARGRSLPSSPRSRAGPLAASRTSSEIRCRLRQLISCKAVTRKALGGLLLGARRNVNRAQLAALEGSPRR